jgi:hypothetical protein
MKIRIDRERERQRKNKESVCMCVRESVRVRVWVSELQCDAPLTVFVVVCIVSERERECVCVCVCVSVCVYEKHRKTALFHRACASLSLSHSLTHWHIYTLFPLCRSGLRCRCRWPLGSACKSWLICGRICRRLRCAARPTMVVRQAVVMPRWQTRPATTPRPRLRRGRPPPSATCTGT